MPRYLDLKTAITVSYVLFFFCRINGGVFECVCAGVHTCTCMCASNIEMVSEASCEKDKFNRQALHFAVIVTWPLTFLTLSRRNSLA